MLFLVFNRNSEKISLQIGATIIGIDIFRANQLTQETAKPFLQLAPTRLHHFPDTRILGAYAL